MSINSREIALKILLDVNNNESYSNLSIQKSVPDNITTQDESLIRELVYGVLENRIYIDYVITKASKIRLNKIHKAIKEILRLGIYQIMFMDRIPHSAAVNESVKLASKYGHKGSIGYVNGILRTISRDIEGFREIDEVDRTKFLSIKYSHPEELVDRFIQDFGFGFTEDLLAANNSTPDLNIRVNTLKISREKLKNLLEKEGYIVSEGRYSRDALIINNPSRITSHKLFKEGYFTIQDESSQLVALLMNPKEGSLVLDVCSAPGGKATHMAQIMNNRGKIISRDIFDHKIKLIDENKKRLGIEIITSQVYNALALDESLIGKIDYCLVDAPCSGLGLIRRKPEIKWNRSMEDINELSKLQLDILDISKQYVKPKGILMYSTCTILDQENFDIVKVFLENNPEFKLVSMENSIPRGDRIDSIKEGYLQLYPNLHGLDGFFIAKMIKG